MAVQREADVATLVRNAFYFSDRIASPQGQIIFLSSSGSTFPPLMLAQIFLPFMPPAFFMTAAGATAPVGSTTIFILSMKNFIIGKMSSSFIVITSSTYRRDRKSVV